MLISWWLLVDKVTDTATDLVNVEREGNILQDAMLPFYVMVHTVGHFDIVEWFSCDPVIGLL